MQTKPHFNLRVRSNLEGMEIISPGRQENSKTFSGQKNQAAYTNELYLIRNMSEPDTESNLENKAAW